MVQVWQLRFQALLQDRAVRNVAFLSLTNVASLLLPLLTFPWITRALGPNGYGSFAFGTAFINYFVIFTDFGFQLAATKRVAEFAGNQDELDTYFWSVQAARLILVFAAIVGVAGLVSFVPDLRKVSAVVWASLPLLAGSLLFPQWLFAGLERMGLTSMVVIGARAIAIPCIFLFVHDPGDDWVVALINASTTVLSGLFALALIVRLRLIRRFRLPSLTNIKRAYADAWHLFVGTAAVSLYSASNIFVLGMVSSHVQVGLFTAADRIRSFAVSPIPPVANGYYPRIASLMIHDRTKALKTARGILIGLTSLMALIAVAMFIGAPLIVSILMGPTFIGAVTPLRILSAVPLLVGMNTVLGSLMMINLGLKREFGLILLGCGLGNVAMLVILGVSYGATGAAVALFVTELAVTVTMFVFVAYRRPEVFRHSNIHSGATH
jgi:O-antigen/teichoic acid export membrane protein